MAKLTGDIQFEGSIGNLTAYKRKGSDKIILRRKGGPTKRQLTIAPEFSITRLNMSEWKACAKMSAAIRLATNGIRHMTDYNTSTALNALNKIIQKTDKKGALGERAIYLSRNNDMLVGFNFNKLVLLNSMLSATVSVAIDRATLSTQLTVPRLIPDVNLKQYGRNTLYRLVATMGIVSDMVYNPGYENYEPVYKALHGCSNTSITDWYLVHQMVDKQVITVKLPYTESITDSETVVVGFGIEYGNPLSDNIVVRAKNGGFAKIIAVG